ncbi:MAG TPA: hypothetical protein VFV27_06035 [Nevskiaceae bacterium]|nr:hypothetical protein [Nevskiaceae bacterium]
MRTEALAALCLLLPVAGLAGTLEGEPFLRYRVEHDSNLFRLESEAQAEQLTGDPERGDRLQVLGVGAALQYSWGLQRAFVGAEARRQRYQRNPQLDHSGHELQAGLDWQAGRALDGELRLDQEKRIQSFNEREDRALGFVEERRLEAAARLAVTPRYGFRAQVENRQSRNSLLRSRFSDLDENSLRLEALYTGEPVASAGLALDLAVGRYPARQAGNGVTREYEQIGLNLTSDWRPSGLSRLSGEIGQTFRDNDGGEDDFSGLTGRLAYQRTVSGKTRLTAELFRRVESVEEIDANYVEETGLGLGLNWQAMSKIGLFGRYEWREAAYEGGTASADGGREDRIQQADLKLDWRPLTGFTLTPGLLYEQRDSNRALRSFEDVRLYLDLEARYD